jgi:CHAT domain
LTHSRRRRQSNRYTRTPTGDCDTGSEAVKIICGDPQLSSISGLPQAFFYAGARSLVSNWAVDSKNAVALMTGAFAALANDCRCGRRKVQQVPNHHHRSAGQPGDRVKVGPQDRGNFGQ